MKASRSASLIATFDRELGAGAADRGKQERVSRVGLTSGDLVGARRREPAAVTRLYRAYAPALFRFFLAAVADRHVAEDLTGEVFKSAIEGLPGFGGPVQALGGWLFGIARHDLSDYRRRQAGRLVQPLDDLLEEAAAAGGAVDPEELALDRVEGDRVLAALQQLTSDQREVLLLRLVGDFTAPEVAGILHKSTEAVKALQHRGLASLTRMLGVTNGPSPPQPPSRSAAATRPPSFASWPTSCRCRRRPQHDVAERPTWRLPDGVAAAYPVAGLGRRGRLIVECCHWFAACAELQHQPLHQPLHRRPGSAGPDARCWTRPRATSGSPGPTISPTGTLAVARTRTSSRPAGPPAS